MTDKMHEKKCYEVWLTERREVSPPVRMTEQIMSQVAELECQRRDIWWLRLVQQIERSRVARWSLCSSALAVGGLPFLFFAYVPSL